MWRPNAVHEVTKNSDDSRSEKQSSQYTTKSNTFKFL